MNMVDASRKSRWCLALTLLLAGLLLFRALRGVNWQEMLKTVRHARIAYLLLGCVVGSISCFVRGLRWRVLLSAEKLIAPFTVFWVNMVGYLGNSFLPARAGELIRSHVLGRKAGLSRSFVLATALAERLLDAVALVLIGLVAILALGRLPDGLVTAVKVMGVAGLAAMVGMVVAPRTEGLLRSALTRLPLPDALRARLVNMMAQFLLGIRAFQHPSRATSFAGLTTAIWLADALGSIIGARALNLSLNLPQALLLLAALGLSSAVPSTPGSVGIYQFVGVTVLVPFGFSRSRALTYSLIPQILIFWNRNAVGSAGPVAAQPQWIEGFAESLRVRPLPVAAQIRLGPTGHATPASRLARVAR